MKIAIVIGSKSDFEVIEKSLSLLKSFDIEYEIRIISAHRTPMRAIEFAQNAQNNGFELIIAVAGKAAHLPGVLASHTLLPVIGLPIKSSTLDGLDSLLSIVQMPEGIPVATVSINGTLNAVLMAIQILSVKHTSLRDKLFEYRKQIEQKVIDDDLSINN